MCCGVRFCDGLICCGGSGTGRPGIGYVLDIVPVASVWLGEEVWFVMCFMTARWVIARDRSAMVSVQ